MIPIKIECSCGQHYAFDTEPVDGRMPTSVACPACGADGTSAANAVIARHLAVPPATAAPAGGRLRIAAQPQTAAPTPSPGPAPRRPAPLPGQMDRAQAEREARAKILWGDAAEEVTRFLMMQGLESGEASLLVKAMVAERAAVVRGEGVRKCLIGTGLLAVPIATLILFGTMGVFSMKLFAITATVGLYGAWLLIKGCIMILAPKSEPGDVADQ